MTKGKKIKKTMKVLFLFTVLMVFLTSLSIFASAFLSTSFDFARKDIHVSMVNQEPDPVEPGQYVDIRLRVENYGVDPTNSIELTLHENFPFTVVGDGLATKRISGLGRRQITSDSQIVTWRLKIDKDAPEGKSELVVSYRELGSSGSVIYREKFYVNVRTSDTILEIVEISSDPADVVPGVETSLNLKLRNLGYSFVKDVSVELDLLNTDIAVLNGNSKKIIPRIDGKSTGEVSFQILADSNSDIKVHKIPVKLSFKDNLNNIYTQESTFGLRIHSDLYYLLSVDESEIITKGQIGDVNIRIANPSIANMKYLQVELVESEQYRILSSPTIYVGNVDSDDWETLFYKLYVYDTFSDEDVFLRLRLTYRDDYNKRYVTEENVYLPLYTSAEMRKYGLVPQKNYFGTIVLFLIVASIVGYFIYKKKKCKVVCKKNNEKK